MISESLRRNASATERTRGLTFGNMALSNIHTVIGAVYNQEALAASLELNTRFRPTIFRLAY
jgi:hypothetical protein